MNGMDRPVVALSAATLLSLTEALMKGEVVSYTVSPSRIGDLEVRMLLLQGVINILQLQLLSRGLHDSSGYQLNVGGIWLSELLHVCFQLRINGRVFTLSGEGAV